jgi:hypothetical protein
MVWIYARDGTKYRFAPGGMVVSGVRHYTSPAKAPGRRQQTRGSVAIREGEVYAIIARFLKSSRI